MQRIKVSVTPGQLERSLKKLKLQFNEHILGELKERQFYQKPSEKKRKMVNDIIHQRKKNARQ